MKIQVIRTKSTVDYTIGFLTIDGEFECYTLEDGKTDFKIPGKSRIGAGVYEVKYYLETSPLTERYRKKFSWFNRHIEITGVDDFSNILAHIGNTIHDTRGCLLVGQEQSIAGEYGILKKSTKAFENLYKKITEELNDFQKVTIEYIDGIENISKKEVTELHGGVLMNFLAAKETQAFKLDTNKWKDYPIQISRSVNSELETFYIQDVAQTVSKDGLDHKLTVILLDEGGQMLSFRKYCKAACPVDWDLITCAFNIEKLN